MANKILVDDGKTWLGEICMSAGHPALDGDVKIHLFSNNITPAETDVLGMYTEAAFTGYAAQTLSSATDGGIDADDRDSWSWPTVTFLATATPGSPVTVYGAYYTDSAHTKLLWVERFQPPFIFTNNGDGFTLTPTFSFGSIF